MFDEETKTVAYAKQTQAVKGKDKFNRPLCAVGDNANKARIYDFDEMDADHVEAWSKGGDRQSAGEYTRPTVVVSTIVAYATTCICARAAR